MASDNILPIIHQDGDIKTKYLDTLSDLAYLLVGMDSRVLWVGFEKCCGEVSCSLKKKGMWMGGHVPKGYDRVEGKLMVNAEEAVAIRNIFLTYLECRCVRKLAERLKHSGIRSKRWTSSTGRQRGGVILSRGSLYHTLNNPIYIGKIAHQGKLHDGQHEPILDLQIWNKVAAMLKDNRVARRTQGNIPSGRL